MESEHEAGDNVVNVGPVAFEFSSAVQRERLAVEDVEGPLPGHHVGAAHWAVDVEEAGDGGGDFEEVVVGVGHEFHGAFAGGVGCEGAVGGGGFLEGDGGGGAVDGAGGGDDEARGFFAGGGGEAGGVEEIHGALDIDLAVYEGVLCGVADGGHGGEVYDGFGMVLVEDVEEGVVVAEVGFDEGEIFVGQEVVEVAGLCGRTVVVGVEVIEANDLIAPPLMAEQGFGEAGADEAGGAGDEDFHVGLLLGEV